MFQHKERTIAQRTAVFTVGYIVFFSVHALLANNYEFIFYSAIMLTLLLIVARVYRRVQLSDWIILSLSAFGLLHLAGGNLYYHGIKLYDLSYLNGNFHFDNIVHTLGIFLATLIVYNVIHPFIDQRIKNNYVLFYLVLILMALGVGSINEIIELTAVVFLNAGASVGDYLNNALDIVFNLIGAVLAVTVIHQYIGRRVKL